MGVSLNRTLGAESVSVAREKLRLSENSLERARTRSVKAEKYAQSAARNTIIGSAVGAIISVGALCASVASYDTLTAMFDANTGYFIDVFAAIFIIFCLSAMGSGFDERRKARAKLQALHTEVERRERETADACAHLAAEEERVAMFGPAPTERESLKVFIGSKSADGSYRLANQLSKAVAGWLARDTGVDPDSAWSEIVAAHGWPEALASRVRSSHSEYLASRTADLDAWERRGSLARQSRSSALDTP